MCIRDSFTSEQLKELATQLSKPSGEQGIEVANMMHDSNLGMTISTANALNISDNDSILELGHGNGKHIAQILDQAKNTTYPVSYTHLDVYKRQLPRLLKEQKLLKLVVRWIKR